MDDLREQVNLLVRYILKVEEMKDAQVRADWGKNEEASRAAYRYADEVIEIGKKLRDTVK